MTTNQTSLATAGNDKVAGGGTDSHEYGRDPHITDAFVKPASSHAPNFAPIINAPEPFLGMVDSGETVLLEGNDAVGLFFCIDTGDMAYCASTLQTVCHNLAHRAGWWTDWASLEHASITQNPYCFSNKLMLIVSELSEAMEGDRKGIKDDKLPHRDMREVELADAVIRIFDLAGAYNMDLGGAIAEKLHYNQQRADHKPENRAKAGGKAY